MSTATTRPSVAHSVGVRALLGTLAINPTNPLAMQGQQNPLTQVGILKLTHRLIEVAESDMKYGECTMKWIDHVKVNDRPGRCIEVVHPQPRRNFIFHIARIFVDDELNLPVRYERYDWPVAAGDRPPLIEQFTYFDISLNAGLTFRRLRRPQSGLPLPPRGMRDGSKKRIGCKSLSGIQR